jgi:hypothetical protein
MVCPKLKVELNQGLDEKVCLDFLNLKKAGVDFGTGIIEKHPFLRKTRNLSGKTKRELIKKYISRFYKLNIDYLKRTCNKVQKEWDQKERSFFNACDRYFDYHPWPNGKYLAYISIFNCNPRFLEDKTFQVYWKHPKGFVAVAAHEMLHFLFYDFFEKNYSQVKISEKFLWSLSEVFNFFILQEPGFVKITNDTKPDLYPSLKSLSEKLYSTWNRTKSTNSFLQTILSSRQRLINRGS